MPSNNDDSLQGQSKNPKISQAIYSKPRRGYVVPGAPGGVISSDVPETPLPAGLQSSGVATVEDARSRGPWVGDGDGSHWSSH
jgi:hypothetical protein